MLFSFVVLTMAVVFASVLGLLHANLALGLICSFLAVAMIAIGTANRVTYLGALHRSYISPVTFVVLLLPCLWMLLQTIPIPSERLVNAVWSSTSIALGFPIAASITIDTGATLVAFAQYCAAIATAGIVVVLASDRRVAELALFLLTVVAVSAAGLRIAQSLAYADLAQRSAMSMAPGLPIFTTIGITLACASEIRLCERLYSRRSQPKYRPLLLVGLACGGLGLAICTSAVLLEADITLLFAGIFGVGILAGIFVIRRWSLSTWGQAGVLAALVVMLFAILAAAPKRDENSQTSSTQSQAVVDRMLSDARTFGSGAGTFESLLPVYREFDHTQLQKSNDTAAVIIVEMGRPFLWISVLALACTAVAFARGSISRGRDYVYASAGAGVVVVVLFLIFVSTDLLSLPASIFVGAVVGLAWAQCRSTNTVRSSASNAEPVGGHLSHDVRDDRIRFAFAVAGLLLTAQAAWLLLAERHGSEVLASPFVNVDQTVSIGQRDNIQEAATVAGVRGDLWAESAFAGATLLGSRADPTAEQKTRDGLNRALRYAPYRSDVWLTFALLAAANKWQGVDPKALLKMAYYTGPNEADLIPARVKAAFRLIDGVADAELQDMVKSDVRIILRRLSNLRPTLIEAYKSGSIEGRRLEEKLIAELDPDYLNTLRGQ